jgi:hypothetical protein
MGGFGFSHTDKIDSDLIHDTFTAPKLAPKPMPVDSPVKRTSLGVPINEPDSNQIDDDPFFKQTRHKRKADDDSTGQDGVSTPTSQLSTPATREPYVPPAPQPRKTKETDKPGYMKRKM